MRPVCRSIVPHSHQYDFPNLDWFSRLAHLGGAGEVNDEAEVGEHSGHIVEHGDSGAVEEDDVRDRLQQLPSLTKCVVQEREGGGEELVIIVPKTGPPQEWMRRSIKTDQLVGGT